MSDFSFEAWAAIISSAVLMVNLVYYVVLTYRRAIVPHVFTWFIWLVTTLIALGGLVLADEGPVVWRACFMALGCLVIFLIALQNGTRYVTRSDWLMLSGSMATIPIWLLTDDLLWSAIWLLVVETLAIIPMIRKGHAHPFQESLLAVSVSCASNILAVLAMQTKSPMGLTYFGGWSVVLFITALVIAVRRLQVAGSLFREKI